MNINKLMKLVMVMVIFFTLLNFKEDNGYVPHGVVVDMRQGYKNWKKFDSFYLVSLSSFIYVSFDIKLHIFFFIWFMAKKKGFNLKIHPPYREIDFVLMWDYVLNQIITLLSILVFLENFHQRNVTEPFLPLNLLVCEQSKFSRNLKRLYYELMEWGIISILFHFILTTGCSLDIVFFLKILWFFWTLLVLLQR